jgi:hypothetical protein
VAGSSEKSEHLTTARHRTPKQDYHSTVLFLQSEQSSNRTSQNNVFFMLHTKNNFSSINKENPAFWLMMSECSHNCITSQTKHITFLASTTLVVKNHSLSQYSQLYHLMQAVCTKTYSFSPFHSFAQSHSPLSTYAIKPLPTPNHFSFYLDIVLSP